MQEYLNINDLNLKKDLSKLNIEEIKQYLLDYSLTENNIKEKYINFIKDKELNDLCLTEKLICLQYTLDNFDVTKEQIMILIESIGDNNE